MHSSPTRILEGIAHQLHHVVLPALDDTYAQSQVRAAIELLGNLSTRVIVDPKALLDAVRADRALLEEVVAVAPDADELAWITQLLLAPVPDAEQPSAVEEAARAHLAAVAACVTWLGASTAPPPELLQRVRTRIADALALELAGLRTASFGR